MHGDDEDDNFLQLTMYSVRVSWERNLLSRQYIEQRLELQWFNGKKTAQRKQAASMAATAVSSALQKLTPLITQQVDLLRGIHKEFADIKDELESLRAFLKDADTRAAAEGTVSDGVQTWVKQLTKIAFRIEDIVDEYMIYMPQQQHHLGCAAASLQRMVCLIKTLWPRRRIAAEIQHIQSVLQRIKERSERYGFHISLDQASSSNSGGKQNMKWHDPRMASLFLEESEVVGFEAPRDELIGWLLGGATQRIVISVVAMGGAGKTTLAKKVFDSKEVVEHFDCQVWITVSQSYTIEELLREMMKQICKAVKQPLPQDFDEMNQMSLIAGLRNYLQQKKYVVLLDDVWKEEFWDEIELALPNNEKGSRIIVTTRNLSVAEFCKKSSLVCVHDLQPLSQDKAWELFCKKAFRFDFNSQCPLELKDLSFEIVQKCQGLPLAIVAVGGLLSTKEKTIFEWQKLHQNISSELENNPHLTNITRILALSFDDLPFCLKSCFLHLGIYPEDHAIDRSKLMKQWIAEGFIQQERGKTLEEVAERYLTELIHRSLVQISVQFSDFDVGGNAEFCQIHDLLREMIMKRMEESNFCHLYGNVDESSNTHEIIRRVSVSSNFKDFLWKVENSYTRSIYIFKVGELLESFWSELFTSFKLCRVLDFENAPLTRIPKKLENLLHLRYLCLRGAKVQSLPRTIGKLQNLETLDLRQTLVREMPRETNKLRKLRHLMVDYCKFEIDFNTSWEWETGVKMKDKNIGSLTSLQTLFNVEVDQGGVELIKELQKLRQLRELRLLKVRREYGRDLCVFINEMKLLQRLELSAITEDEMMDLSLVSSPPQLRSLFLKGRLEKLPDWIPRLEYLVQLTLLKNKLPDDPLKPLKDLPNLWFLMIGDGSYEGEILHFEEGGFRKLKTLLVKHLHSVKSILIDNGSLCHIQEFELGGVPQLKEVPSGIQNLEQLQVLHIVEMPQEFYERVDPNVGHWVFQHVPIVKISRRTGPGFYDLETRITRRSASHI